MRYRDIISEIMRMPADEMDERRVRELIRTALDVRRGAFGTIGDVRVSMGEVRREQFFILSRDRIAYGAAILYRATVGGVEGFYVTEIGLRDELRYSGIGYAFYQMLLDRGYTLFSGGMQTPSGEKVWRSLMRDPRVTVRAVRLDDHNGDQPVDGADPWGDADIRLIATSAG